MINLCFNWNYQLLNFKKPNDLVFTGSHKETKTEDTFIIRVKQKRYAIWLNVLSKYQEENYLH